MKNKEQKDFMKTRLENELSTNQKDTIKTFEVLIKCFEAHIKYYNGSAKEIKKIKHNLKSVSKNSNLVSEEVIKLISLYTPMSTKLIEASIYMVTASKMKEIIRKANMIIIDSEHMLENEFIDKTIMASMQEHTISVFKDTIQVLKNIKFKDKTQERYENARLQVRENEKKFQKQKNDCLKKAKKDLQFKSYLELILYLQALNDIEYLCLAIISYINKNSYRL